MKRDIKIEGELKSNGFESAIEVYTYNDGDRNYNNKYDFIASITVNVVKGTVYGSFQGFNGTNENYSFVLPYEVGDKNITTKMRKLLSKELTTKI